MSDPALLHALQAPPYDLSTPVAQAAVELIAACEHHPSALVTQRSVAAAYHRLRRGLGERPPPRHLRVLMPLLARAGLARAARRRLLPPHCGIGPDDPLLNERALG